MKIENKYNKHNPLEKPGQVGRIAIKGHAAFGTRRMSFLGDVTQLPLSIFSLPRISLKYWHSDREMPRRHGGNILEGFDKNSGRYVMRTRLSQNLSETSKTQGGAPENFCLNIFLMKKLKLKLQLIKLMNSTIFWKLKTCMNKKKILGRSTQHMPSPQAIWPPILTHLILPPPPVSNLCSDY